MLRSDYYGLALVAYGIVSIALGYILRKVSR